MKDRDGGEFLLPLKRIQGITIIVSDSGELKWDRDSVVGSARIRYAASDIRDLQV